LGFTLFSPTYALVRAESEPRR